MSVGTLFLPHIDEIICFSVVPSVPSVSNNIAAVTLYGDINSLSRFPVALYREKEKSAIQSWNKMFDATAGFAIPTYNEVCSTCSLNEYLQCQIRFTACSLLQWLMRYFCFVVLLTDIFKYWPWLKWKLSTIYVVSILLIRLRHHLHPSVY